MVKNKSCRYSGLDQGSLQGGLFNTFNAQPTKIYISIPRPRTNSLEGSARMQEHRLSRTERELYERFLSRKGDEGEKYLPSIGTRNVEATPGTRKKKKRVWKTATPLAESP